MLAALVHRGPDGEGRYASPDGRYVALFRRLAIIDLQTGDQPIFDPSGDRVLVGNGEIYNYVDLRAQAGSYPYRTHGDMETVMPHVLDRGDDFVHALNGMYALALYERSRHRLVLVRDRLGIKPLYWARTASGAIVFASEIKAILVSGLVKADVDEDSVESYLAHGYVPAPATLFRGIQKLPPAHRLVIEADGRETLDRYWFPKPDVALPRDPEGIERYLLDLLRDSVRLQLQSDVPIGALLSGGLDSGLMVALAAGASSRPVNTFTVRFHGADYDETPLARMVAERYATSHRELDIPTGEIAEKVVDLAWYTEEPLADASLLPNFLIERALAHDVKVALNGTGGDELFAGYPRYFQLPEERRYLALPRWIRAQFVEPLVARFDPHLAWRLARADDFEMDRASYLHGHSAYFPPPLRAMLGIGGRSPIAVQSRAYDEFCARWQSEPDTAQLYADLATYLPEDLLLLLDRSSMATGVEGRVPYLDHRLVEAALTVPAAIRTPGGRQKSLQRSIARNFLPSEILAAPKRGFASPMQAWMRGGLKNSVAQLLTSPTALSRGWWTRAGVERFLADPARHGHRIYSLMMLELTVRLFAERPVDISAPSVSLDEFIAA